MIYPKEYLINELNHLHNCQFGRAPSSRIIDLYIKAHYEIPSLKEGSSKEFQTLHIINEKKINALLVEPLLRRGKKRHLLSKKILLVTYLAECDLEYSDFESVALGGARSFLQLFCICLGGVRGLVCGLYLRIRYDLV